MSGPIRSEWIKFQTPSVNVGDSLFRNMFAAVVKYFDNHPGYTRVASNYGVGGTGLGFTWEASSSRGGAFCVWRNVSSSLQTGIMEEPSGVPPFDIAFVFGETGNSISTTSSWEPAGSTGVWYTVAYHSSSASWNGTTNNNGQDNWTTTPWKSGSIVLCRANGVGGDQETNRRALTKLNFGTGNYIEMLITGDNDTTAIALRSPEAGPSSLWNKVVIFGGYQRATASVNIPLMNLKFPPINNISYWQGYGSTTTDGDDCGIATTSSINVRKVAIDYPRAFVLDSSEPAGEVGNQFYALHSSSDTIHNYIIEWPVSVMALEWDSNYDTLAGSRFVMGGYLHNIRVTGFNGSISRKYDRDRRVAIWWSGGDGNGNYDVVFTLPWNSSSVEYRNY